MKNHIVNKGYHFLLISITIGIIGSSILYTIANIITSQNYSKIAGEILKESPLAEIKKGPFTIYSYRNPDESTRREVKFAVLKAKLYDTLKLLIFLPGSGLYLVVVLLFYFFALIKDIQGPSPNNFKKTKAAVMIIVAASTLLLLGSFFVGILGESRSTQTSIYLFMTSIFLQLGVIIFSIAVSLLIWRGFQKMNLLKLDLFLISLAGIFLFCLSAVSYFFMFMVNLA